MLTFFNHQEPGIKLPPAYAGGFPFYARFAADHAISMIIIAYIHWLTPVVLRAINKGHELQGTIVTIDNLFEHNIGNPIEVLNDREIIRRV